MKPPAFRYHDPRTLDEVIALLGDHGDDCKVLAGGQSLVPLLNLRLARPAVIVDVNRVAALGVIAEASDGGLRIGALVRHRELVRSDLVRRRLPLLRDAARCIGHAAIRTRGTVGGSIAHGDPAAELPGIVATLGAEIRIRGPMGERSAPAATFYTGPMTADLAADELITDVLLPPAPAGAGWAFEEVARRHGDFAVVGVAVLLALGRDGRIGHVRIGVIGSGPVPLKLTNVEGALVGETPGDGVFAGAAEAAAASVDPHSDLHASAAYRRHLVGVLLGAALATAVERARLAVTPR